MQLTIVGGGGFRVPLLYRALAGDPASPVDHLVLTDSDATRLEVVSRVIAGLGDSPRPHVRTTTDVGSAVDGADVVVVAIRVGGTSGRVRDEEIALRHGLLGLDSVGAGSLAHGLRAVPVARALAALIAERAPHARVINLTNPAGVITRAMHDRLGDRVIGVCDTPMRLVTRVATAIRHPIHEFDYVGVNHLGWLRSAIVNGRDVLPALLEAEETLAGIPEARMLGQDVVESLRALPIEYLYYYWYEREAGARLRSREPRGRQVHIQQRTFFDAAAANPPLAAALWEAAVRERADSRGERGNGAAPRTSATPGGTDSGVVLPLLRALSGSAPPAWIILGVRNLQAGRRAIAQLPDDALVEIPCLVNPEGIHPRPVAPVTCEMAGLMTQVSGSEELALRAATEHDPVLALRSFACHPLVDSLSVARSLLDEYCAADPALAAAIGGSPAVGGGNHSAGRSVAR